MTQYEPGYFLYNLNIDYGDLRVPPNYIPEDAFVPYLGRRPFRGRKSGRMITEHTLRDVRDEARQKKAPAERASVIVVERKDVAPPRPGPSAGWPCCSPCSPWAGMRK